MQKNVLPAFPGFRLGPLQCAAECEEVNFLNEHGARPVYRWKVSFLFDSLDPANPGLCGVIEASEEMLTPATQRALVIEITQSYDLFTLFSSYVFYFMRKIFHLAPSVCECVFVTF